MLRKLAIAAVAAALGLGLAFLVGCSKKSSTTEGSVVAKANGRDITRDELSGALEDQDMQAGGRMLDNTIARQLIRQEADKRGIKATESEIKSRINDMGDYVLAQTGKPVDDYLKQLGESEQTLEDQTSFEILLGQLTLPAEARRKFFDESKDSLKKSIPTANDAVIYRRIVVATKPEADAIRKELSSKPGDFAKAADSRSLDPMTRGRGGMAGWAVKGELQPPDPELEKTLFSLKPGEISQPLPFKLPAAAGAKQAPPEQWQVVKVEKRITPKPFTLDNYAPQVEQRMLQDPQYSGQIQQFVGDLESKASIQILSPHYKPMADIYKQRQEAFARMRATPQGRPGMAPGAGGPGGSAGRAPGRAPSAGR